MSKTRRNNGYTWELGSCTVKCSRDIKAANGAVERTETYTEERAAYRTADLPGIAVVHGSRDIDGVLREGFGGAWSVTHDESGLAAAFCQGVVNALTCAYELGQTDVPWSMPEPVVVAYVQALDVERRSVMERIAKRGGRKDDEVVVTLTLPTGQVARDEALAFLRAAKTGTVIRVGAHERKLLTDGALIDAVAAKYVAALPRDAFVWVGIEEGNKELTKMGAKIARLYAAHTGGAGSANVSLGAVFPVADA